MCGACVRCLCAVHVGGCVWVASQRGHVVETELRFRADEDGRVQPMSRVNLADFLTIREQRGQGAEG